jgi:GntR family transcriptional regulator, transcriptional repressor for pyruvate dehydrogenase complex
VPGRTKPDSGGIRKRKAYEEAAKQIQDRILIELRPGDKLPSEHDLAQKLGVSRSSVKEAIRSLELVGVVRRRSGSGTVVRIQPVNWSVNPAANILGRERRLLRDLFDFWKMLGSSLAVLAAKHASAQEISEMEAILRRQQEKVRRGDPAIEEVSRFHYAIAKAAENTVVLNLFSVLMDMLLDVRERSLRTPGRPRALVAEHKRILAAIKVRDAAAAKTALRRHINEVRKVVLNDSKTKPERRKRKPVEPTSSGR